MVQALGEAERPAADGSQDGWDDWHEFGDFAASHRRQEGSSPGAAASAAAGLGPASPGLVPSSRPIAIAMSPLGLHETSSWGLRDADGDRDQARTLPVDMGLEVGGEGKGHQAARTCGVIMGQLSCLSRVPPSAPEI